MSTTTDSMSIASVEAITSVEATASVEAITSVEATASVETYTPIYCTDRKCSDILHMCQFSGCHKFMCKSCVMPHDVYVYLSKNNLLKMICADCLPRIYAPKPTYIYETSVSFLCKCFAYAMCLLASLCVIMYKIYK